MRTKKALVNSFCAGFLEIVNVIMALVVPKLIIDAFGSETNGLIVSITHFLGYISLMQAGIGNVIRANLYKPLADNDSSAIKAVFHSGEKFFRKLSYFLILYILILAVVFPLFVKGEYSFVYVSSLVVVLGLSTLSQYFFGFTCRSLLMADQKEFIYSLIQSISVIISILIASVLIIKGFGIHIVKLVSLVPFIISPIILNVYTRKKYKLKDFDINNNIKLSQRWSAFGHSIADFVHRKTDYFVLTLMSTLFNVSIYSVYSTVINGVYSIISVCASPLQAALGNIAATDSQEETNKKLGFIEYMIHSISTVVFGTCLVMIDSFITIYLNKSDDVRYHNGVFALLIIIAELLYCCRQPLLSMIMVKGCFKDTQRGAYIEAGINIVLSVALVTKFGLAGIAVGTLSAMIFRTIDLFIYVHKTFDYSSVGRIIVRYLVTFGSIFIVYFVHLNLIDKSNLPLYMWIIYSAITLLSLIILILLSSLTIYRKEFFYLFACLKGMIKKKK